MLCRHGESRTTSRRWTRHTMPGRNLAPLTRAGRHALTSCDPDASRRFRRVHEYERAVAGGGPRRVRELMRSGLRAQNLAPSLFASVKLASYKEYVAVERGLVSADLAAHTTTGNRRKESPVTAETRDRLVRISVLQEAALQSFQAFAPKPLLTSFSRHAAKPCVHDAVVLRTELLDGTSNPPPTHDEWFELQSCRVDSLQGLMDEIQTTIIADAKASQRAALKRLAYLGMPLLLLCFCAATVGFRGKITSGKT